MKLSDYVMRFINDHVADSVFLMAGGGIMHLVDSLRKSELKAFCCHHEQAAVIAAEGYGRIRNKPGVAIVTTGPGGTNAVTGIAGAWLDSIPMLIIAGQVKKADITPRENGVPTVRAIGWQELNVIDIVKPITKYAVTVEDGSDIKYHLQKAIYLATHGRPGPVFIEIPLDVQATEINLDNLSDFSQFELGISTHDLTQISAIGEVLRNAKKPLLVAGNGIRLAGGEEILWKVLEKLQINAVTPLLLADDLVTYEYPYYLGRHGILGNKAANYSIDNCDALLIIGDRQQLMQTSYDHSKFATQATVIMVDIDKNELSKNRFKVDIPVHCDAKLFLETLYAQNIRLNRWDVKVDSINPDNYETHSGKLNIFRFFELLSQYSINVVTANGMASVSTHQALNVKRGNRFITNVGLAHMGSGLPMAIGACVADDKKPLICTEGDGSIMLNIQELQTVVHHRLPIRIFIFNNNGYYSIRNTHKNYFGENFASDPDCGVSVPDFSKIIPAFGLEYERINNDGELGKLKAVMEHDGPIVCELMIDPDQPMLEKWSAGMLRE